MQRTFLQILDYETFSKEVSTAHKNTWLQKEDKKKFA